MLMKRGIVHRAIKQRNEFILQVGYNICNEIKLLMTKFNKKFYAYKMNPDSNPNRDNPSNNPSESS